MFSIYIINFLMHIEYIYNQKPQKYKFTKIHPILEIYRGLVISRLFDDFYKLCLIHNNNIQKNKTDDFITRFCWTNLTMYDPVLPYRKDGDYNYDQLKIDLKNYNISEEVIKKLDIENFLKKKIKHLKKFYKIINYDKYIDIKIENDCLVYKDKYKCTFNNLIIKKFNKFFDGRYENNRFALFFCILYRYNLLDAKNQQLAIDLDFKYDLQQQFGVNVELFGSAINRFFGNFCSLFYDLEMYFGSLGNFFNVEPKQGLYMANPPYDESLMENMAKKLIYALDNTTLPLGFIITIPIWDSDTQKKINQKCKTNYSDMGEYKTHTLLTKSKYYYKHFIFCKHDFKYYNIIYDKHIPASNTYIFIIKNNKLEFNLKLFENLLIKHKLIYFNP
jgi:hypothetical protein